MASVPLASGDPPLKLNWPPLPARLPPVMIRLSIELSKLPPVKSMTRLLPPALMVIRVALLASTSPWMSTASVICSSPDVSAMVAVAAILKAMLSLPAKALALAIAWRNDPAPESLVLVTVNTAIVHPS